MTALYICYQSISDPLTRTQVVAYLEGLVRGGHRMVLLTFEPEPLSSVRESEIREELLGLGVVWAWLKYHKRPSVPATAFDMANGVRRGYQLARQHQVDLFHVRGHVAALMGLWLKRFCGKRLLFDIRGFLAEEYVDAGIWPADGWLFRMAKRWERTIVRASDGFVVLTQAARQKLMSEYSASVRGKPLATIPCCVDLRAMRTARVRPKESNHFVYIGKFGGWYWTEALACFMSAARELRPGLQLRVFTQTPREVAEGELATFGLRDGVTVSCAEPGELPGLIRSALAGLCFIRPTESKKASSPTKLGDYLAAGLPVAGTAGIGDVDQLLLANQTGVLIPASPTTSDYRVAAADLLALAAADDIGTRCQWVAHTHLDLATVGWPSYLSVYDAIMN